MSAIKEFYGGTFANTENEDTRVTKEKVELKYYKIINTIQSKKSQKTRYGVEVVRKSTYNNIVTEEKKDIFNCVENEDAVDKILEVLKSNKVSPSNVEGVLEFYNFKSTF